MISFRYAPILCLLVTLALVPIVIHGYVGLTTTDGRTVTAIPTELAGMSATPGSRDETWGRRRFDSHDWFERRYASGQDEVVLTVVRSYDLKTLYHHPELAVAYGTSFLHYERQRLPSRPDIPVHVLRSGPEDAAIGLYVLHYGEDFVERPILFQIRTAGELLFSPRRPMTLFFARGTAAADATDLDNLPAARVLFEAVDRFVAAKGDAR
jgi:hypothetical protein